MTADGMPPKLISAYYASTKVKARASGGESAFFEFPLASNNVDYMADWYLGPALQVTPGIQVGTSVHVSDLVHADDIVLLERSFCLLHINTSKTKMMSLLISGERCQHVLPGGEPLQGVDRFQHLNTTRFI